MNEIVAQHINNVFLFQAPVWLLWVYLFINLGLIIVLFLPGLVSNPISVVVGSVLGAGFFFTVLPTIPALQAYAWRVE